jgi:thiamine-phosphate pyrophosphorylase
VILPRLLVLTDRTQCHSVTAAVSTAVAHGARAVVLREKDLPPDERAALADALRDLLDPVDGLLILAGRPDLAGKSLVDGVHLAAGDPVPAVRPPILGRSCHDAAELAHATGEGCDYVTLSPVFPSPSKPGYGPPLGPSGLAGLRSSSGPAVYALGGVTPGRVAACRSAGAYGVAVMGSVMREPRLVADFLSALESTSEDA